MRFLDNPLGALRAVSLTSGARRRTRPGGAALALGQTPSSHQDESLAGWLEWARDHVLGPCAGGNGNLGWGDCQMQCGHLYPGSKGWCRAVAPDCSCLWCECHMFGEPGPDTPEGPEGGPIIIT